MSQIQTPLYWVASAFIAVDRVGSLSRLQEDRVATARWPSRLKALEYLEPDPGHERDAHHGIAA